MEIERINTFLGAQLSQNWNDFPIWELFFTHFPIKTFLELGTDKGGMSVYFALQGVTRGFDFHTYDHQIWHTFGNDHLTRGLGLAERFHHLDLFSSEGTNEVARMIRESPKPLGIFFDDGNKPKEWSIFAPLTSPGDYCIVHDWEEEFFPKDIGDVKVERVLAEFCDRRPWGWRSMWFRRTE